MNFMEAIEYGLSNLISSLKKDREKQWKATYPTKCLLKYGVFMWSGSFECVKFGPFKEEQSNSCSLCNHCTFSWFNEWPGLFTTKKGHRSKLSQLFYCVETVVDQWKTFENGAFILCCLLWLWFLMLFNQEGFTKLKLSPANSVFFS